MNVMANQQHLELLRQGGANLMDANLHGATLNWARLDDTIITDEQLSTVKSRLEER